jgi:hypothetical protein
MKPYSNRFFDETAVINFTRANNPSNPTPTLTLPPAFVPQGGASRRQAEGEGNCYVPPPSRGGLGGGWGICRR